MSMPKEPRQKMINIMYLVLTALLALNVSSEILNAFKTVDHSLVTSNGIIENKNQTLFKSFQEKLAKSETKEKAELWWPKAKRVKDLSESMFKYIEDLKLELKKESGLATVDGQEKFNESDLDAGTRLFLEAPKEKGKELFQKLADFKAQILAVDPEVKANFEKELPLDLSPPVSKESGEQKDLAFAYFHMTPTIAGLTILSKFQNDIKNSEAQIVEFCHKKIGEVELVFDQYQPLIGTNALYLMPGQELNIHAGIGAYSKAAQPHVTVDGSAATVNADGMAEYKTNVGGPGSYSKKVRIDFFNQAKGKPDFKEEEIKYTVGSPTGASVSADAVKVLYIGLKNPLTISGGSVGAEKTNATIDNGSLTNAGNGKYIAEVTSPGEATINVNADGKPSSFKFKVKRVPSPTPMVGASEGGRIPANQIKAQAGIRAELKDFVFDGVEFNVTSFVLLANGGSFPTLQFVPNQGAAFSAEARNILNKCTPGTTLMFDEIKAVGPDGTTRKLPMIAFNLY